LGPILILLLLTVGGGLKLGGGEPQGRGPGEHLTQNMVYPTGGGYLREGGGRIPDHKKKEIIEI